MRPFCWNDPQAVAAHVARLAEKYTPAREHGVFVYSLGDENDTLGCCLSPHCLAAYRDWLRQTYGSLEKLNRSWGTAFGDWREVGLSAEGDAEEAASLSAKNYPRWFDRQAFKSANYINFCRKHADAFTKIDPLAKTWIKLSTGCSSGRPIRARPTRCSAGSPRASCRGRTGSATPRMPIRSWGNTGASSRGGATRSGGGDGTASASSTAG